MDANNADSPETNPRAPTPISSHVAPSQGTTTVAQGTDESTRNGEVRTGFDFKRPIDDALNASKFQGTLLVFAFVVIKVLLAAESDTPTALAIINASGIVPVVVGAALSSLPILAAGLFVVGAYRFGAIGWRVIETSLRNLLAFVLAAIVVGLLAPWPVVGLGLLPFIVGLASRRWKLHPERIGRPFWRVDVLKQLLHISFAAILICVALVPLGWVAKDALFVMWTPREKLELSDDRAPLTGYVLENKEGWISLLKSEERKIVRIHSEEVIGRSLCRKNYHESIWQVLHRTRWDVDTRVYLCPGATD